MRTTIAINDANVFIDFYEVGLLEALFELSLELHITDLVLAELEPLQKQALVGFIQNNLLKIKAFDEQELLSIIQKQVEYPKLSLPDCSILHHAQINNYMVLTGDKPLRTSAENLGIVVKGTLWLLDELVGAQIISTNQAYAALTYFDTSARRLPKQECAQRLALWKPAE